MAVSAIPAIKRYRKRTFSSSVRPGAHSNEIRGRIIFVLKTGHHRLGGEILETKLEMFLHHILSYGISNSFQPYFGPPLTTSLMDIFESVVWWWPI